MDSNTEVRVLDNNDVEADITKIESQIIESFICATSSFKHISALFRRKQITKQGYKC